MITKYIVGDITETPLRYIAHGVNCQNVMGSGVAKALYTKFPEVKEEYHLYTTSHRQGISNHGPRFILGRIHRAYSFKKDNPSGSKRIYNCYTQFNFGYDGKRYVNYSAIIHCFENLLKEKLDGPIAIPKIGCGLAGGDWNIVEQLINDTVGDDLEIWVYELEPTKYSKQNGDPG